MKTRILSIGLGGLFLLSIVGCNSSSVEVIDLNKVLDALTATLDEQASVSAAGVSAAEVSSDEDIAAGNVKAIDPTKQDPVIEEKFLASFREKLNAAKMFSEPLGVSLQSNGDIMGFRDTNGDTLQDMSEDQIFTVSIDVEQSRLIASDGTGNYRPHSYHGGHGMMTGYLIGSMLGRQNSYYSGPMATSRPSFTNTPMSSKDYHASAVRTARSRVSTSSSSARMRTGSGGFSFGK